MGRNRISSLWLVIVGFVGASLLSGTACADRMQVFVSIVPQKYFVEKIGGEFVEVSVMVGPGANPHTYEPKPQQMAALSKARGYFAVGIGFEDVWLEKMHAMNPRMQVIHTDEGIRKIQMGSHHHHEGEKPGDGHKREPARPGKSKDKKTRGEHSRSHHGIPDPHVWTSPPEVLVQARNILRGLIELDPGHSGEYEKNYQVFLEEIVHLDLELMEIFKGKKGLEFMVFHPAWGYFAEAYGLKQVPVEIEGKEPKPAQLQQLIAHARKRGIKVIFVQPQLSSRSAETIAEAIHGEVVPADPLAEDWGRNLHHLGESFKGALR